MKHLIISIRVMFTVVAVVVAAALFPPRGPVVAQDDDGLDQSALRRCSPPSPRGDDPCGCRVCDWDLETCCVKLEGIVIRA